MIENFALKADEKDNVATVFANRLAVGDHVCVHDKSGQQEDVLLLGAVPYGHKLALVDINKDERIVKYGEVIGAASCDIKRGDYVHVHNMVALRGRGDLKEE